ncbi:MAG: NADH-quinone oxidoreductase subunit M [Candidatus Poseidoniales archaeon]|nr:NADH-quinone oxidoreductase subunit M [Candidatus Poseidoniales archaeon]
MNDLTTAFGNPLSLLVLLPIVAGATLMLVAWAAPPSQRKDLAKHVRLISFGLSLLLFVLATLMFLESYSGIEWFALNLNEYAYENCTTGQIEAGACALISGIGVSWHVGVDGLSFPMVWLTTLLVPVSMLVDWNAKKGAYFHTLLLMMEGALIGVFVSLDLFLFYVFWELTLIPMFFLILMWGGENRRYAAQKFFIYTFTASVIMLAGILILYFFTSVPLWEGNITGRSFDVTLMAASATTPSLTYLGGFGMQKFVFLLLLAGFAAKMPSVPVHTWLPDAHVEAPTAGSMLLAGVMLKMGAYGFIRVAVTLLPEATIHYTWLLLLLGMVSLVYAAWVCLGQTNLKRLVAYSSVSHMGLIFLGIATMQPLGIAGALFMMLAHGLISPLLFAVAGAFKHHYHTLEIGSMRGIARHSPGLAGHMMLGCMASLGLPLLAGFVAEIAILIAFWMAFGWLVLLPALTLIITGAYYIWAMQRTIFEGGAEGEIPESMHGEEPVDITWHENVGMFVLAALITLLGVLPFIFFDMMSGWSSTLVENVLLAALNGMGGGP